MKRANLPGWPELAEPPTVEGLRDVLYRRLHGTWDEAQRALAERNALGVGSWDELIQRAYGVLEGEQQP